MRMASENETLADIVAEMRGPNSKVVRRMSQRIRDGGWRDDFRNTLENYADRLESAWKREREDAMKTAMMAKCEVCSEQPLGNAAAMREALENAHSLICEGIETEVNDEIAHPFHLELACEVIQRALSAPARNCDVGTAEEQVQRMTDALCMKQWKDGLIRCSLCPISCTNGRRTCTLTWAQMPYAQEGGAAP